MAPLATPIVSYMTGMLAALGVQLPYYLIDSLAEWCERVYGAGAFGC